MNTDSMEKKYLEGEVWFPGYQEANWSLALPESKTV